MHAQKTLTTRVFYLLIFFVFSLSSQAVPMEWISWSSAPKVALTFDDGPHPEPTRLLSDILSRFHVSATFFIVGSVAAQYPEVLRQLSESGHEISNHTWSHPDIRTISRAAMREELDQTRALIQAVTGQRTFLFRTPGGRENFLRRKFRIPAGYELVLWDIHSLDQEGIPADQIVRRVLSQIKNGDVVLMHNGLASTRDALEVIIPELKRRGFVFVTVSQLQKDRTRSEASLRRATFLQG